MTASVLERPDLKESPSDEDIIHMCCTRCYPLPGPAMSFCGEWKEWTYLVGWSDPRPRCKECPKLEVRKMHVCLAGFNG